MNTVVLDGKSFSQIHNALCSLRSIGERLSGNELKPVLESIVTQFEIGLRDAYNQDHDAFDKKMDHYDSFRTKFNLSAIWNVYEVNDLNEPHPYVTATKVCYAGECMPLSGARWLDLYLIANCLIVESGDLHHIFIEGFRLENDSLILGTGS
jgi:hypothetical protein